MRYEHVRTVVLISLVFYFVMGVVTNPYPIFGNRTTKEVYPFFSWFLFAKIPNPQSTASMRLLSYGDKVYEQPLPFSKTDFLFRDVGQSPTQYLPIIRSIARDLARGGDAQSERAALERIFLKPTTYEIVYLDYDQLEYWKTGAVRGVKILGTFTVEKNL